MVHLGLALLAVCAAALVAIQCVSAHNGVVHVTWIVGDDNGWTWPAPSGYNFTAWAAKAAAIKKSDKLTFNYLNGTQNVLQVTAADYANCSYSSPIYTDNGLGPTNFSIKEPGDYYFVCSVLDRCKLGMKFHVLAANVTEHAPSGPAPAPHTGAAASNLPTTSAAAASAVLAIMVASFHVLF